MLAIALSGIKLYKKIIKSSQHVETIRKPKIKKESIKLEIYRHSFFCILMTGIIVLSSFVEVYISANLFSLAVQYM